MASMSGMTARLKSERGAQLIEFAFVLPLLLLVLVGIVDFGFMFQRFEVVTNAAREGARIAVLPGYSNADVCARALTYAQTGGVPTAGACPNPTNPTVAVEPWQITVPGMATPMAGRRVQVTYTHQFTFIRPIAQLFGSTFGSVPLTGVAIMRDELQAAGS